MYYEEKGIGNKKTIIFIHGAMWPRSFSRQESLGDKYHAVFFHMNGHGKEFSSRFDREEIVAEIVAYIKTLDNKPHIAGFSLGTQIALMLADKHSDLIDKVVLISPLVDATDEDIARIKFTMKALGRLVKLKPLSQIAAAVLKIEQSCKKEFIEEMKEQDVNTLAEDIMSERLNMSDLPDVVNISNQFFIAIGAKDQECFIESGKKLKRELKNSTITVYANCGHNIPITEPKRFNSQLRMFFK